VRVERAEWSGGALRIGALGSVEVFARNIGRIGTAAGLQATLVSLDPGAEVLSGPVSYATLASRTSGSPAGDAAFLIGTVDTLTPGRLLRFRVEFRDRSVELGPGEFIIVPHGVEHRTVADEEAEILVFEPAGVRNTGNVTDGALTAPTGVRI